MVGDIISELACSEDVELDRSRWEVTWDAVAFEVLKRNMVGSQKMSATSAQRRCQCIQPGVDTHSVISKEQKHITVLQT